MLILTVYGRQAFVTKFFAEDVFDAVPTLYVCYTTSVPPANADGTQLEEPDPVAGYARLAIDLDSAHWVPTGFGEVFNAEADTFPVPTADWGYIVGVALTDAEAIGDGNVYAVGEVAEPFRSTVGVAPALDVGSITFGLYE